MERRIPNYGYVPFKYFQYFLIILILLIVLNYKKIDEIFTNFFFSKREILENSEDENQNQNIRIFHILKTIVLLIPLIVYMYYDMKYSSFSFRNLGISKYIPNYYSNYILRVLGALGIIQVLAQDIGVKTGLNQRNIVQSPFMQLLLYVGTAFAITDNRSEAIIGAILYFTLKYGISSGKTSPVCFESV